MGLFDFFKSSKPAGPTALDWVWRDEQGKRQGLLELLRAHPQARLLAWSAHTQRGYSDWLAQTQGAAAPRIELASRQLPGRLHGEALVFLEHHLYRREEAEFLRLAQPAQAWVLSSLDDPLFRFFGNERIGTLVDQLGMKPGERLEHRLIRASIRNAQQKLEKQRGQVAIPPDLEDWMRGLG